jgi:hypothetical protein
MELRQPYASMDGLKILQTAAEKSEPRVGELKLGNLVDSSIVQKMDGSGFFEKLYADYGVK